MDINQYLNKGFIWDGKYWETHPEVPQIEEIDYEDAKKEFWVEMDDIIEPLANSDNVLFTMSSGLDTSSILSHAMEYNTDPNVVCLDNGRGDAEMAEQLAEDWGFTHLDIVHVDPNKIEPYLLDINSILSLPVAHTYLFLFLLLV
jgi:asparagine synthetase B (glutamine-hydrolysing)